MKKLLIVLGVLVALALAVFVGGGMWIKKNLTTKYDGTYALTRWGFEGEEDFPFDKGELTIGAKKFIMRLYGEGKSDPVVGELSDLKETSPTTIECVSEDGTKRHTYTCSMVGSVLKIEREREGKKLVMEWKKVPR